LGSNFLQTEVNVKKKKIEEKLERKERGAGERNLFQARKARARLFSCPRTKPQIKKR